MTGRVRTGHLPSKPSSGKAPSPGFRRGGDRFDQLGEEFVCTPGCTACCQGVVSLSVPELFRIGEACSPFPPAQLGCPFRTMTGCAVYAVRPFMCRLFGFHFLHPALRRQPFCSQVTRRRPGDGEAALYDEYLASCEKNGFVLLGGTGDAAIEERAIADNHLALARFPAVAAFLSLLTGAGRCLAGNEGNPEEPEGQSLAGTRIIRS